MTAQQKLAKLWDAYQRIPYSAHSRKVYERIIQLREQIAQ